jgi:hypothetical protein
LGLIAIKIKDMKHFKLIVALAFSSLICSAQITKREIITKEAEKPLIFDSTFFGYNEFFRVRGELKKNIGQKIYILPISKIEKDKEYRNFFFYVPYYEPERAFNVAYDSLANHILTILDANYRPSTSEDWYLKLLYQNRDTIYFVPYDNALHSPCGSVPFILTAFMEKSKNQFLNKTFIEKKDITTNDISTGEEMSFSKGEKWDCTEITLVDLENPQQMYYTPVLILKNSKGNEILVNFAECNFEGYSNRYAYEEINVGINDFYTIAEYKLSRMQQQEQERLKNQRQVKEEQRKQEILKKYGNYFGKLINNEKVAIGMTKEMCALSWGKPFRMDEITTESGKYELWQYDYKTFIYFEGNTLKIIKQ